MPIASSMDNCQLQQAIEPGRKASETNDKEANLEESHDDDICEEDASQGSFSRSSDGALNWERKYVPTLTSRKESSGQTESLLTEMKETMNTIKTLALDTSSKEILDFLRKESQRQAARDKAFSKIMAALVQQPYPIITFPVIRSMSESRNQFWFSMTNFRCNSSLVSHQGSMPQKFSGSQMDMLFIQQINNPNFP